MNLYKDLHLYLIVVNYTLCHIAYYGHYMFDQSSYDYIGRAGRLN